MASSFPHRSARAASLAVDVRDAQRAPGVLLVLTKDNAPPRPHGVRSTCRTALRAQSPRSIPTRCAISASLSPSWSPKRSSRPLPPRRWSVSATRRCRAIMTCTRPVRTPRTRAGSVAAMPADSAIGDFESAFANAPVQIDAVYTTPYQHQAPMEPHATMAVVGGPDVDRPYLGAVDDKPAGRPRPNVQHPQGECPHHHALCRRRLRQQVAILCRRDTRRDRRPHAWPTGQGGDDAAAALSHHHPPHRIRAAPAAGRGPRRPADRLWPGCARAMRALRRASPSRSAAPPACYMPRPTD